MQAEAIFNKMVEIITPFVKNQSMLKGVSEHTDILEDLKVNSARFVDIIIEAEDTFDVEINDEAADSIKTIGDAVNIIGAMLN